MSLTKALYTVTTSAFLMISCTSWPLQQWMSNKRYQAIDEVQVPHTHSLTWALQTDDLQQQQQNLEEKTHIRMDPNKLKPPKQTVDRPLCTQTHSLYAVNCKTGVLVLLPTSLPSSCFLNSSKWPEDLGTYILLTCIKKKTLQRLQNQVTRN